MQKILVTLILLWLGLACRSQLYVQSGAGFKTTGNVQITLDSTGITNNDASADFSQCILHFKNTGVALLDGSGTWVVKTLVLNKPAYTLKLGSPLQVTNQVQLTLGILDLNNQLLTLAPGATIEGENFSSNITGPNGGAVQTTVSLNAPLNQNPGNIGAQITSSQNLGTVTIKRWHKPDGNSSGKIFRFYEITPANNIALNAALRLYYLEPELNNITESSLELFNRSNAQNPWTAVSNTTKDASLNYIEKTALASLQQYGFGANTIIALPVTWGTISASCKRGQIQVKWSTLQESGIYNFMVQRSTDRSVWTDLGPVPASGNSTSTKNYSYTDVTAPSGITLFYRIAAVQNKSYAYSPVASATGCKRPVRMQLSPVPATTSTNLTVYSDETYQATIKLYGADGGTYQQRAVTISAGSNLFLFNVSSLPNGTYYLQVLQPDGTMQAISFTKQ